MSFFSRLLGRGKKTESSFDQGPSEKAVPSSTSSDASYPATEASLGVTGDNPTVEHGDSPQNEDFFEEVTLSSRRKPEISLLEKSRTRNLTGVGVSLHRVLVTHHGVQPIYSADKLLSPLGKVLAFELSFATETILPLYWFVYTEPKNIQGEFVFLPEGGKAIFSHSKVLRLVSILGMTKVWAVSGRDQVVSLIAGKDIQLSDSFSTRPTITFAFDSGLSPDSLLTWVDDSSTSLFSSLSPEFSFLQNAYQANLKAFGPSVSSVLFSALLVQDLVKGFNVLDETREHFNSAKDVPLTPPFSKHYSYLISVVLEKLGVGPQDYTSIGSLSSTLTVLNPLVYEGRKTTRRVSPSSSETLPATLGYSFISTIPVDVPVLPGVEGLDKVSVDYPTERVEAGEVFYLTLIEATLLLARLEYAGSCNFFTQERGFFLYCGWRNLFRSGLKPSKVVLLSTIPKLLQDQVVIMNDSYQADDYPLKPEYLPHFAAFTKLSRKTHIRNLLLGYGVVLRSECEYESREQLLQLGDQIAQRDAIGTQLPALSFVALLAVQNREERNVRRPSNPLLVGVSFQTNRKIGLPFLVEGEQGKKEIVYRPYPQGASVHLTLREAEFLLTHHDFVGSFTSVNPDYHLTVDLKRSFFTQPDFSSPNLTYQLKDKEGSALPFLSKVTLITDSQGRLLPEYKGMLPTLPAGVIEMVKFATPEAPVVDPEELVAAIRKIVGRPKE